MFKNPYICFASLLCFLAVSSLFAQNDPLAGQDSIVLENDRIEEVVERSKPFMKPPYQEIQEANRSDFQFNSRDFYVETNFEPTPPVIKPWPKEKKEDFYNNSLSLGIGRFITPYGKLTIHNGPQDNLDAGLDFTHLSAHQDVIPLRKFRRDYGTVYLNSLQQDYQVGANVYLYNTTYFPYADTVLIADEVAREDSLKLGFTRFRAGAQFKTNYNPDSKYEADAGLSYSLFAGNRGNTEGNLELAPTGAFFVTPEFKVGLESNLTFTTARLAGESESRFFLDATPFLGFDNGTVRVRGGVRYNLFRASFDSTNLTNFGGLIELTAAIQPETFSFLAGYQTGMTNNTYYDLMMENPYLQREVTIRPTIEKLHVYVGGKGNVGGTVDYSARIYYKRMENQLMFFSSADGFYFDLVYDSLMTVSGTQVEVNFSPEKFIDLGATFTFNIYNTSEQEKYWNAAPLRLDVYGVYRWEEKLTARAELLLFGPRTMSIDAGGNLIKQGLFPSINLQADYRITDQFSVFLQTNNILGFNYQRWHNYPERRIDFLGGISLAF